ncbi:MAG: hypothetical protein ACKPKO_63915, partial [Candidatus Fonsibacter sp.]
MENHNLATAVVVGSDGQSKRLIKFFIKCGRWAAKRMVGLAGSCRASIDRYGDEVLRCISAGKRPDTHKVAMVELAGNIDLVCKRALAIGARRDANDVGASHRGGKLPAHTHGTLKRSQALAPEVSLTCEGERSGPVRKLDLAGS